MQARPLPNLAGLNRFAKANAFIEDLAHLGAVGLNSRATYGRVACKKRSDR
jgi:hypothetical protein